MLSFTNTAIFRLTAITPDSRVYAFHNMPDVVLALIRSDFFYFYS